MNGITKTANGEIAWTHEAGDSYLVTGTDVYGKKFSIKCGTWFTAKCINLYRGNKYLVRNGKKIKLQSVYN